MSLVPVSMKYNEHWQCKLNCKAGIVQDPKSDWHKDVPTLNHQIIACIASLYIAFMENKNKAKMKSSPQFTQFISLNGNRFQTLSSM
jgi:hypothetical protein